MKLYDFEHKCPYCGNVHSNLISLAEPERRPQPGDYSVCVFCAAIMRTKADGVELVGEEELTAITQTWTIAALLLAQSRVFSAVSTLRCVPPHDIPRCKCGHPRGRHNIPYETNLTWRCAECDCFEYVAP